MSSFLRSRPAFVGDRSAQGGQILVIFVVAIVAIIGMVGIVIDGGSAFAQRRDQQNVADLASMAGATAYLNTTGTTGAKTLAAEAAARQIATDNGYTNDVTNNVLVDVVVTAAPQYADVHVGVRAQHQNHFAGVLGMPTWEVSVDAIATTTGAPNTANGPLPLIFNEDAFDAKVCTRGQTNCTDQVFQEPGTGNEDVPQDATQFNWTIFCTANGNPCNADSDGVADFIDNSFLTKVTVSLAEDIGPLNAGSHTTLFDDLAPLVGGVFPVPIVDDAGVMQGFAYFKLTGVEGSSQKVVRGYFLAPYEGGDLTYVPGNGDEDHETGAYAVVLTD